MDLSLILALVAAILAIIEVARSQGRALLPWAVLCLAAIFILPLIVK